MPLKQLADPFAQFQAACLAERIQALGFTALPGIIDGRLALSLDFKLEPCGKMQPFKIAEGCLTVDPVALSEEAVRGICSVKLARLWMIFASFHLTSTMTHCPHTTYGNSREASSSCCHEPLIQPTGASRNLVERPVFRGLILIQTCSMILSALSKGAPEPMIAELLRSHVQWLFALFAR